MSQTKNIRDITDDELEDVWVVIGGTPHLFEYTKDDLKHLLVGDADSKHYSVDEDDTITPFYIDYYTMVAIVKTLEVKGYKTCNKKTIRCDICNKPIPNIRSKDVTILHCTDLILHTGKLVE